PWRALQGAGPPRRRHRGGCEERLWDRPPRARGLFRRPRREARNRRTQQGRRPRRGGCEVQGGRAQAPEQGRGAHRLRRDRQGRRRRALPHPRGPRQRARRAGGGRAPRDPAALGALMQLAEKASLGPQSPLAPYGRITVKIGSSLLVKDGLPLTGWMATLAADIDALRATGREIVIVSS